MPLCVFTHTMNKITACMILSLCSCSAMCVCVVGKADKQAMGWEVEGLHRLRLLTQFWQNVTPRAPRNPAGGAQRCNLIPSIQQRAPKTHRHRQPGTQLHLFLYLCFCLSLPSVQQSAFGDFFSTILSVSCRLAFSCSLSLLLRTAY